NAEINLTGYHCSGNIIRIVEIVVFNLKPVFAAELWSDKGHQVGSGLDPAEANSSKIARFCVLGVHQKRQPAAEKCQGNSIRQHSFDTVRNHLLSFLMTASLANDTNPKWEFPRLCRGGSSS